MFFFLSKTLSYLTMPWTVVCVLLILSAVLKAPKWKKRLFYTALTIILFFSNGVITNEVVKLWEVPATPLKNITKKYEWGIVLTGVTRREVGPEDRIYFSRGADRVTHTLQLYKMGIIKKILISGGSGKLIGKERKEAEEFADAFELMGVPRADMLLESQSRNTHESSVAVKALLQNISKPEDCILITSAYHMRRSRACFAKAGWPVDTYSTDFLSSKGKYSLDSFIVPGVDSFSSWATLIREWTGMVAYKMAGYI